MHSYWQRLNGGDTRPNGGSVDYKRGEGYRQVAATALHAVIVGMRAEQRLIDQVLGICKERDPAIEVLQAAERPDTYEFQILPLP